MPEVLKPCGTVAAFGGQTLRKVSPAPCRLVHIGARTGYQRAKVSVEGEKSDQLLQQTAWSKAASRPHTLEVWKVLPIREGAGAPPCAAPGALVFPAGDLLLRRLCRSRWHHQGRRSGLAAAPSPGHGTGSRFALLFQVAAAHVPEPEPEPESEPPAAARATVLPLTRQHLVAWFPRALLPRGLFPYLGGKRNRETERGPKPASERLPARAARCRRGWQPEWAPRSWGGPAGVRQRQGLLPVPLSAAPKQSSSAAGYYGTAASCP